MSRTLIITTWGSPFRWGCADYIIEDKNISVRSCCTLPLLTSMYPDSDVVIVALDSLIDAGYGLDKVKSLGTCGSCSAECWGNGSFNNYNVIEDYVKGFVECVVDCIYKRDGIGRPQGRIRVVVGPSVGSPSVRWRFEGRVGDFPAKVLLEVGLLLDEILGENKRISSVVFDATHGINFMPAATLQLADKIASLIAVRQLEEVKIEVYNSDPYPQPSRIEFKGEACTEAVGSPRLNLNLIDVRRMRNIYVPHAIPGKLVDLHGRPEDKLREDVEKLRSYLNLSCYTISTLYYPLPFMLVYACNEFPYAEVREKLNESLKIWKGGIKLDSDASVKRLYRLNVEDVYTILLASFACKGLESLIDRPDMSMGVKVEDLEKLKDLYDRVSEVHGLLVGHEISLMKGDRKDKAGRCDRVKNVYGSPSCVKLAKLEGKPEEGEPDKRVMIAHAGFQAEFTDLCVDDHSNCLVKYSIDYKKILENTGLYIRLAR